MKSLRIKNFKCFEDEEIEFRDLTVLAGPNGSGKSSVVQVLLLLKQSDLSSLDDKSEIIINDYYCSLGSVQSLLNCNATDENINFEFLVKDILGEDEKTISIVCKRNNTNNTLDIENNDDLDIDLNFLNEIEFISADRFGPKSFHYTDRNFEKYKVGKFGEYSALVLHKNRGRLLEYKIDEKVVSLRHAVNYWANEVLGDIEIETDFIDEANVAVLKMTTDKTEIGMLSPVNMPYGASYVLPILVGALIRLRKEAEEDGVLDNETNPMIIIENPEAHLHPSAQSKLGIFLAVMAHNGVKLVVETHSEHILNGIRIAVKSGLINNNKVLFNYFDRGEDIHDYSVEPVKVEANGKISHWPNGFFDQYEKDMMELM